MFISIKKKSILIVAAIIICAVSFCFVVTAVTFNANAAPKKGKIVVIDAGHGGIDGGVSGVKTGVKESDINLAIARSLKHFLTKGGYEVIMTRSTTDGLYGMASKNRKQKDMAARKEVINKSKADLVVSIHQNSYPRAAEKGAQVFYAPKSEEGIKLASSMQRVINSSLSSDRNARPGDYFILQCSTIPSLLVECGFLSNPEEEKLLVSASYQEKVAYVIYSGIHTILSDTDSSAAHTHISL